MAGENGVMAPLTTRPLVALTHALVALIALVLQPLTGRADQRVLVIGIDGLRADALEAAATPQIKSLYQNGAGFYARGYSEDLTFSGPNWSSILNGVHRDLHGVDSNSYTGTDFTAYPNFLARLEDAIPGINTARYTTWSELNNNFTNPNNVDVNYYQERNDAGATAALVNDLQTANPQAAFLYFGDVDYAGHDYGFVDTPGLYFDQIAQTDAYVGQVLAALHARPGVVTGAENWLVIVTSDHGGLPNGTHSGNSFKQREIPFVVSSTSGSGVVTATPYVAPRNVDLTKTVLTWMNVPTAEWGELDGHVVGLVPSVGPIAGYGRNLVFNGDGEYDRGFRDYALDQAIAGWNDQDQASGGLGARSMTLIEYGSPAGFPSATDPGPLDRGANFFSGGNSTSGSTMTQLLDLSPLADDLDEGLTQFVLSAWLGGFSNQNDRAQFRVEFLDESGVEIGESLLGPVTNTQRGNVTGLLYREATGFVPVGTRTALFALETFYAAGAGTDGYADNLSFVLIAPELNGDFDNDGDIDGADFLAWQRGQSPHPLSASDLADWQANYGIATLGATTAVPEPATLALILLPSILLLSRGGRERSPSFPRRRGIQPLAARCPGTAAE